jgi:hypothetical protein
MFSTKSFKGLNNISDPLRLGLSWLAQADNVDITETGALQKRTGYRKTLAGTITGAYSTLDFTRMFVVDDGTLKAMTGPAAATPLLSGISPAPMHFTEINNQVFFNNGVDRGVIQPDNTVLGWGWQAPGAPVVSAVTGNLPAGLYRVCCTYTLPDGRETGAGEVADIVLDEGQALQISGIGSQTGCRSNTYIAPANSTVYQKASSTSAAFVWNSSPDALGVDLQNKLFDALPLGAGVIQAWRGRIYAAQYLPTEDQTVVWFSEPLGFHLFNLNSSFLMVSGRVLMLAPHDDALLIGTDQRVYAYFGEKLEQLASYGVAPGQHWSRDDERILFWSKRGLCSALPFSNLTEARVSVAPGVRAGGCVIRADGQKRYVVALQQGGLAFNSHV